MKRSSTLFCTLLLLIVAAYDAGGTFGALGETLLDWIFDGAFGMNYDIKSTWSKTIKWRLE